MAIRTWSRTKFVSKAQKSLHIAIYDFQLDESVFVTGSFTLSRNAESNAENALTVRTPDLIKSYQDYVEKLIEKYGAKHA